MSRKESRSESPKYGRRSANTRPELADDLVGLYSTEQRRDIVWAAAAEREIDERNSSCLKIGMSGSERCFDIVIRHDAG